MMVSKPGQGFHAELVRVLTIENRDGEMFVCVREIDWRCLPAKARSNPSCISDAFARWFRTLFRIQIERRLLRLQKTVEKGRGAVAKVTGAAK
jgi:hypothetical protein